MQDLLARIASLPSDLEALFRKTLDRLEPSYFAQASVLFQLMAAAAPRPLSMLSFAFAEDGFDKAMVAEIKPLDRGQLNSKAESIRRRLNSRSKGLLEATPTRQSPERAHVQYLHRTVKDFLPRRDIWTYIVSGTDAWIMRAELKMSTNDKPASSMKWIEQHGKSQEEGRLGPHTATGQIRSCDISRTTRIAEHSSSPILARASSNTPRTEVSIAMQRRKSRPRRYPVMRPLRAEHFFM